MRWNYLSIPKLQQCNRWSLGIDKLFYPTLYWTYVYSSMPGLMLIHVSKMWPLVNENRWKKYNFLVVYSVNCFDCCLSLCSLNDGFAHVLVIVRTIKMILLTTYSTSLFFFFISLGTGILYQILICVIQINLVKVIPGSPFTNFD